MIPSELVAPRVTAIHIAAGSLLEMKPVGSVVAQDGCGLVGDRYYGSRHRHVSIQSATALVEASNVFGRTIEPAETRRNITISTGDIPSGPGHRIHIGQVELEVVRVAAPCRVLDDQIGIGAKAALRRRAGSICRILAGGTINLGDEVHLHT